MSYEPTLVIKKSDLEKHKSSFETYFTQREGSERYSVYKYLNYILNNNSTPKIDGIELLICKPELTSFNASVRKILHDFDVQFSIDY